MLEICIKLQQSHCRLDTDSPLSGKRRWNYCKWQTPTSSIRLPRRGLTAGWVWRGLRRCSCAGQDEARPPACLLAAVHESHSLLSLKCPWGPWREYLSSLTTSLRPRCLWATVRCFLCALKIARPGPDALHITSAAAGTSSPSALSRMTVLTPSPLAPWEPLSEALVRAELWGSRWSPCACMLSASVGCFPSWVNKIKQQ